MLMAQTPQSFGVAALSSGSVVINEFMALPQSSCTEKDGEWIELYNNTGDWVNLSGWVIRNSYGEEFVLSTYLLPPEGYFVAAACGDQTQNGGVEPNQVYGNFRIRESGTITIYDSARTIIDQIEYNGSWPILSGASCERINPGWSSGTASSWDYSKSIFGLGDYGTPGQINSVYENSFTQNSWAFIKAFVQ
jgi:hypothetical protein